MKRYLMVLFIIQIAYSEAFSQDSLYYVTLFHGTSNVDQLWDSYGIGDVNGDGLSDFIIRYVGSSGHTDLYYGAKNLKELKPAYVFKLRLASPIGDVNCDGYTDLMTSEPDTANSNYPYTSAIFRIYFGGKELDTVPKFIFKFPYYFHIVENFGENIGDINPL